MVKNSGDTKGGVSDNSASARKGRNLRSEVSATKCASGFYVGRDISRFIQMREGGMWEETDRGEREEGREVREQKRRTSERQILCH